MCTAITIEQVVKYLLYGHYKSYLIHTQEILFCYKIDVFQIDRIILSFREEFSMIYFPFLHILRIHACTIINALFLQEFVKKL